MFIRFRNYLINYSLNYYRKATGVASEAILAGICSVIAHLSSHSIVQVTKNYLVAPCMFFCTSGVVGSNKTGTVGLIQRNYIKMENMMRLLDDNYVTGINASIYDFTII